MNRKRRYFIGFGLFIVAGLIFFAIMLATGKEDNLVLTNTQIITGDNGNRFINGTLINKIDRSFTQVEVVIYLFDKNDKKIGNQVVRTDFIPGGKSWEFKVPINNKSEDFEIISISTAEEVIRPK